MNLNKLELKMNRSLFSTYNISLSDLTVFEFGDTLNDIMIFIINYKDDIYYYYPIEDKWTVNEGWTYFKRDESINESKIAFDFQEITNLIYNDLLYIGNWDQYKKFSRSNYYYFKHPLGIEYLYDRLTGMWIFSKSTSRCCCHIM